MIALRVFMRSPDHVEQHRPYSHAKGSIGSHAVEGRATVVARVKGYVDGHLVPL